MIHHQYVPKARDYTFIGLQKTFWSLDDNLNVSSGSESECNKYVTKFLKKLIDDNLRINLQKSDFNESELEWHSYKLTQTNISHSCRRLSQECHGKKRAQQPRALSCAST